MHSLKKAVWFQNYQSTNYALITHEELIKKYVDKEFFLCSAFEYLINRKKHLILPTILAELKYHGVGEQANNCL